MAEKIQENPLPEEEAPQPANEQQADAPPPKPEDKDKPVAPSPAAPRISMPSFTKTSPNDLYRRLLPAVLFLLTFVTVMTILLIYMDTVALGAQQFRLNMSRDYELARIPQESPPLVAYVRQLHLAPRARHAVPPAPAPTERSALLDRLLGEDWNGTFVEWLARGPRERTTSYLEAARGWDGVVVRAAARDYLALRGGARALHACLSPTQHPREVTYHEADGAGGGAVGGHDPATSAFSSRVLCLPLYTVLLAADATRATYVLLGGGGGGGGVLQALRHLPFDKVHLQVLEIRATDDAIRNKTAAFLHGKNYTTAATFQDGVVFTLKGGPVPAPAPASV